jgi:opacity protein-like surface antigen
MRIILTASVAAAALLSAAAAQAQTAGYVGANYARTDGQVAGFDVESDGFEIEGSTAFTTGNGLGVAVDGAFGDAEDADSVWTATGHLNTNLGGARVGGFAGFVTSDGDTLWGVGAEGQADLAPNTVLYGQLGYGKADDLDLDAWAVRAELRQYVTENFKLAGAVGYITADQDLAGDLDAWTFGADAEYQFAGTPFSVFGGYERLEFDDVDADADTFRIGVRYTFGGSLRARDAAGAELGSVNRLFGGLTR